LQSALSRNVKKSFKRVLDLDIEADKFQNVIISFPNCVSVKFGEVCATIIFDGADRQTDKQTTRQTNATDQQASQNFYFMKLRLPTNRQTNVG